MSCLLTQDPPNRQQRQELAKVKVSLSSKGGHSFLIALVRCHLYYPGAYPCPILPCSKGQKRDKGDSITTIHHHSYHPKTF